MSITGNSLLSGIGPNTGAVDKAQPKFAAPGKGGVANNGLIRENESIASVGKEAIVYSIPRSKFREFAETPPAETAIRRLIVDSSRAWKGIGAQEATA